MISNNLTTLLNKLLLFVVLVFVSSVHAKNINHGNLLYDGFRAIYDVSKNNFHLGLSERRLIKESTNQYTYKSLTYATGIVSWFVKEKITEISHYQLIKNNIVPTLYELKNTNGKPDDNFNIIFDSKNNTVVRTTDNKLHEIATNKQDLLSFQVAIMLAIQRKNKNIKFTIVDKDEIHEYSLQHTKDEKLATDIGEINTYVIESSSNNNKYHFIFWCAKKYNFLPIKVKRIEPDGDTVLIQINRINGQAIRFYEPFDDEDY